MEFYENEVRPERAFLVSVDTGEFDAEASMSELYELTESAGASRRGGDDAKRGRSPTEHVHRQRKAGGAERGLSKPGDRFDYLRLRAVAHTDPQSGI